MLTFCSRIRLHGTWNTGMQIVNCGQEPNKEYICHQWEIRVDVMNGGERRVTSVLAGTWETCKRFWWCLKWRVKYWAKMSTTYITNYWEGFENLLTHCYNTHRAQYLSIAILHAQDSQSVSCNSFLQMKWYKNVLFGCFTSIDSNFQNQHKYYSSAASNVNTNI